MDEEAATLVKKAMINQQHLPKKLQVVPIV